MSKITPIYLKCISWIDEYEEIDTISVGIHCRHDTNEGANLVLMDRAVLQPNILRRLVHITHLGGQGSKFKDQR